MTDLSLHARDRLQQRAIPPYVIELLDRFGCSVRSDGAETVFFDQNGRKALRHHLGGERGLRLVGEWLNAYFVVADGGPVLTAGHRDRRFQRDRSRHRPRTSISSR